MLSTCPQPSTQPTASSTLDWQRHIHHLVLEARNHPPGSRDRNRCLNHIIREVTPKLWRFHTPYYADALQQTWVYFTKHVCTDYDPNRASMVTWLNTYLRFRHQDLVTKARNQQQQEFSLDTTFQDDDRFSTSVAFDIPARNYGSLSLLDEVLEWVKTDASGQLKQIHLNGHPEINGQTLIMHRLPPETPWKTMATEFGVSISTLSSFYTRKCLPLLRQLAETLDTAT